MTPEDLITLHEGRRARPYRDTVGKLTVGVGRNIDDVPFSDDEIDLMLKNDVKRALDDLLTIFRNPVDQVRWAALIDMRFNLGPGGFRAFHDMIAAVEAGDWDAAADAALNSKWATQVPNRAKMDAEMLRTGIWPNV